MPKRKYRHGQLRPLHERMTPEQLQKRAAKTEVRRLISVEHAKTRGMVVNCMGAAQALYRVQRRDRAVAIAAMLIIVALLLWVRH